jgi:hypothetical protein
MPLRIGGVLTLVGLAERVRLAAALYVGPPSDLAVPAQGFDMVLHAATVVMRSRVSYRPGKGLRQRHVAAVVIGSSALI